MAPRRGLSVPDRLPPSYSLLIAAFVIALDYAVAPDTEFPGLFVVPVVYAAWYGGLAWGVPMSLLPFAHLAVRQAAGGPVDMYVITISAVVRAVAMAPVAMWVASVAASQRALSKEVAMLQGLLPICSYCKKIRDDSGNWQALEKYISDRSDATFTHGICETCLTKEEAAWKRA